MNIHSHGDVLRRREEIVTIAREQAVHSQEELLHALRRRGFRVTQPTLSRDIAAIGLIKTPSGYVVPGDLAPVTQIAAWPDRFEPAVRAFVSSGVELVGLYSSSGGSGGEIVPAPGGQARVPVLHGEPFDMEKLFAAMPDVVFLATPNEVSATLAPKLVDAGIQVIDLSGAFRLDDPSLYPSWYGFTHERPALLNEAVYGLTVWCNGELKKARLVANPGCYPTSILLALRPLTYVLDP